MTNNLDKYLSGEELYGNSFSNEEIAEWFNDEEEGYANLGARDKETYQYSYHELNKKHGFTHLPTYQFKNALGLGSAYGDEFLPILNKIESLTIIDSSEIFSNVRDFQGVPCDYIKPNISGDMRFKDNNFDLITCLGVLHHIPNVTHVINECYRCLSKEGFMLIREPIVSMGDWFHPRPGLTKRERGIPYDIFQQIIEESGFTVVKESVCVFPVIPSLSKFAGITPFNNRFLTKVDSIFCNLLKWNYRYHPTQLIHKFRPTSVFYVLRKEADY